MLSNKDLEYLELQLTSLKAKTGKSIEYLPTAIYARKSEEDLKDTSLKSQIEMCQEEINNCPFLHLISYKNGVFQDDDKSGMFTSKRSEFNELKSLVEQGQVKVIVVYSTDRLSRRAREYEACEEAIEKLGGAIISVTESYTHNASGKFARRVMAVASQYHAENTAELVVRTNLRRNAPFCKNSGGIANYGYYFTEARTMEIDQEEAMAVRLMFKRFIEMKSYQQIIDELTSLGHYTRAGKPFTQSSILTILKNVKYTGTYFYNKADRRKKMERVIVAQFNECIVQNGIPRIISDEDFELVQQRLKTRAETFSKTPKESNRYPLTGVLFCGECGSSYHGSSKTAGRSHRKYEQYICSSIDNHNSKNCKSKPISKDQIELVVAGVLTRVLNQSVMSGPVYRAFQKKIEESIRMSIDGYQRSKTAVLRKQSQIVYTIIKTTDEKLQERLESEYQATITRINEIENLIKELQSELKKTQNRTSYFKKKISQITPEELVNNRPVFSLLVKRLIKRIEIGEDITIELL